MGIFAELQRRNVIRVALAYLAGCWLLVQVAETLFPVYEIPDSIIRLMVTVLVIGFPVALVLAWVFELTPEGIRKESNVDRDASITPRTGQTLNRAIMVMLVIGIGFLAIDKFVIDPQRDAELAEAAAAKARVETREAVLAESRGENSIAVLPFRDMSEAGDQQYFSDGISEELLNALVRVEGLEVASRTSSFTYRDDTVPVGDIAKALLVDHVLEGSVRRAGDRVRITAQLIDARSDRHLWSDTYDRDLDDVLKVQDEIANAIVDAMKTELGLDIGEVRIASETESADAYDLYLKGRALILARSDMYTAVEALERSLEIDPNFAKAWEVLGAAYFVGPGWGYEFESDGFEMGWQAADRALQLDESLALPWSIKASIGLRSNRLGYHEALEMERRAIELDPKSATVRLWHALNLSDLGFHEEALESVQACLDIDPFYENCRRHLAHIQYILGDEDSALANYLQGAENGFTGNHGIFIPLILRKLGRETAAIAAVSLSQHQGFPVREFLDALENPGGDHSEARRRFVERMGDFGWNNSANRAIVAVLFGYYDGAQEKNPDVLNWIWNPDFAAFRQSDEFRELVTLQGQVAYWRSHGYPPQCQALPGGDFRCD